MNDYEKLSSLLSEKAKYSLEFLNLTKEIESLVSNSKFYEIDSLLSQRKEIIKSVDLIDMEFLELYTNLSKDDNFQDKIRENQLIFKNINSIKENFQKAYEIDSKVMPVLNEEFSKVKLEIKNQNNKKNASNKYSDSNIESVAKSNFGIFIDEVK